MLFNEHPPSFKIADLSYSSRITRTYKNLSVYSDTNFSSVKQIWKNSTQDQLNWLYNEKKLAFALFGKLETGALCKVRPFKAECGRTKL